MDSNNEKDDDEENNNEKSNHMGYLIGFDSHEQMD